MVIDDSQWRYLDNLFFPKSYLIIRLCWCFRICRKVFKSNNSIFWQGKIIKYKGWLCQNTYCVSNLVGIFFFFFFLVWVPLRIVGFILLAEMKYWFMWLWFSKVYHRPYTSKFIFDIFRIVIWTLHFLSMHTYL